MGIYDREYVRMGPRSKSGMGSLRFISFNSWIIIINVAVFFLDGVFLSGTGQEDAVEKKYRDVDDDDPAVERNEPERPHPALGAGTHADVLAVVDAHRKWPKGQITRSERLLAAPHHCSGPP